MKCITKCRKNGLDVPTVFRVEDARYRIYMEFIEGQTVRDFIFGLDLSSEQGAAERRRRPLSLKHVLLARSKAQPTSGRSHWPCCGSDAFWRVIAHAVRFRIVLTAFFCCLVLSTAI